MTVAVGICSLSREGWSEVSVGLTINTSFIEAIRPQQRSPSAVLE